MKQIKKVFAVILTAVMVLAMSVTAFAADPHTPAETITVTPKDKQKHTYEAYQIFKGNSGLPGEVVSADDTTAYDPVDPGIASVAWGSSFESSPAAKSALINALKADSNFKDNAAIKALTDDSTAASVAGAIGSTTTGLNTDAGKALAQIIGKIISDNSLTAAATATATTDGGAVELDISASGDGYYFIQDSTNPDPKQKDAAAASTRYILEVIGDTKVTAKSDVPSVEKKVDDKNDSATDEDTIKWQDTADYDKGDIIPYRIKGTLPSNYDDYSWYYYRFVDNMTGMTVFEGTENGKEYKTKVALYANEAAFTADTTATGGEDITGNFTITGAGTTSLKVEVNNFDENDEDKIGLKGIDGITKDSVIVVYYYTKLSDDCVIGKAGNPNDVYLEFSNNPNSEKKGDKGDTPRDYNKVFTFEVDVNKVQPEGTGTKPLAGAGFVLYKEYASAEAITAAGKTAATALPQGSSSNAKAPTFTNLVEVATIAPGTDKTQFVFERLDAGKYVLVENIVPTGFNPFDALSFEIEAEHEELAADNADPKLTSFMGKDADASDTAITLGSAQPATVDFDGGKIDTKVINRSGTVLPETGGIGTTIFYVLGAVLVIGAGVVLVTRRRMSA